MLMSSLVHQPIATWESTLAHGPIGKMPSLLRRFSANVPFFDSFESEGNHGVTDPLGTRHLGLLTMFFANVLQYCWTCCVLLLIICFLLFTKLLVFWIAWLSLLYKLTILVARCPCNRYPYFFCWSEIIVYNADYITTSLIYIHGLVMFGLDSLRLQLSWLDMYTVITSCCDHVPRLKVGGNCHRGCWRVRSCVLWGLLFWWYCRESQSFGLRLLVRLDLCA